MYPPSKMFFGDVYLDIGKMRRQLEILASV
jgi:hypothetical protein